MRHPLFEELWGCVALSVFLTASTATPASPPRPRVTVETDRGAFTIELYPDLAPETVARFLARAGLRPPAPPVTAVVKYAGTTLCPGRLPTGLLFGCPASGTTGPGATASSGEPPQPDEIDGEAMGLGQERIAAPSDLDALWKREAFARYNDLLRDGKPVPPRLQELVDRIQRPRVSPSTVLRGQSRLWYLEALGFRYTRGRSPLRVTTGAVATASLWPGEADARFLVATDAAPLRSGRCTVFGKVVDGWAAIAEIERARSADAGNLGGGIVIKKITERSASGTARAVPDKSERR